MIQIPIDMTSVRIEPFSPDNLDLVEKMVTAVWGSPDHRPEFDHAFCGHLARYNYYDPELSFQIVDEEGIQGVCWAYLPGKTNDAESWVGNAVTGLTDEERKETYAHVDYLKSIDTAVCKMMGPKDVKISFLIAQKKGYGTFLLQHTMKVLSERGFENLYLWTDSSCNWQFYPKHGFEKVHEERCVLYSTPEEDFKFMVFRKRLDPISPETP
ncbi:MAG: GNAT family N-acetyltransferase [Bacteroidales bacterium]|nr:GNAT family N-acetyltransferase [Bacteroidales bacterium]